jgi:hypothetical protein
MLEDKRNAETQPIAFFSYLELKYINSETQFTLIDGVP